MDYQGKCYGGPWDGRTMTAAHTRVSLVSAPQTAPLITLTPPEETNAPIFAPVIETGHYKWNDPDFQEENRGKHWQWHDRK